MNLELLLSIMFFLFTLLLMYTASEINLNSTFSSYRVRNYLTEKEKHYQEYFNWFTLKSYYLRDLFEEEINLDFNIQFDEFCYLIFTEKYIITIQ